MKFHILSGLVLVLDLANGGSSGPNRGFTEGPFITNGEFTYGCVKDRSWFCETCCCKWGNAHWRDYRLDNDAAAPDFDGDHNPETLGEPKPSSREVRRNFPRTHVSRPQISRTPHHACFQETQTQTTQYNKWSDGIYRYHIVLMDTYPEDCKVCRPQPLATLPPPRRLTRHTAATQVCAQSHTCSPEQCDLRDQGLHADGGAPGTHSFSPAPFAASSRAHSFSLWQYTKAPAIVYFPCTRLFRARLKYARCDREVWRRHGW